MASRMPTPCRRAAPCGLPGVSPPRLPSSPSRWQCCDLLRKKWSRSYTCSCRKAKNCKRRLRDPWCHPMDETSPETTREYRGSGYAASTMPNFASCRDGGRAVSILVSRQHGTRFFRGGRGQESAPRWHATRIAVRQSYRLGPRGHLESRRCHPFYRWGGDLSCFRVWRTRHHRHVRRDGHGTAVSVAVLSPRWSALSVSRTHNR